MVKHDQISPKDIYRLVGEYNKGSMKEFDIIGEMLQLFGSILLPCSPLNNESNSDMTIYKFHSKLTDGYITISEDDIVENELSLDGFIRDKLSEIERMHDYSVGTDTVRCWLDEYNDLSKNKLK